MRRRTLSSVALTLAAGLALFGPAGGQGRADAAPASRPWAFPASPRPPSGPEYLTASVQASRGGGYVELSDVAYGFGPGQVLDVFLPTAPAAAPRPGVIVVHGGGWEAGSRADMTPEAEALARAGLVAINVGYRLDGPGSPGFPTELSDVEAALAWARSNAALLHLDPGRMGALGASAGGNLALELGALNQVSAVVSWSGPTRLAAFEAPPYRPCTTPACGPLSMPYAVFRYLGCLPAACPAAYAEASPAERLSGSRAAFLLWNSAAELIPRSQADLFAAAAARAGVRVEERILPGARHANQYAGQALDGSIAFLLDHL